MSDASEVSDVSYAPTDAVKNGTEGPPKAPSVDNPKAPNIGVLARDDTAVSASSCGCSARSPAVHVKVQHGRQRSQRQAEDRFQKAEFVQDRINSSRSVVR